ncbi:MAG: DUF4260 domain-containing protein [Chitinophagales bacterium]
MQNLLKIEQVIQLILGIIALYYQPIHFAWWLWIILFLSPDLSMVGYIWNSKVGATLYNIAHHKAIAGLLIISGVIFRFPILLLAGLLLWSHSSFDRIMGYGLKYNNSFQHTHLGHIGKKE